MSVAIRVEGLGKKYRLHDSPAQYGSLRESLMNGVSAPWRRASRLLRAEDAGARAGSGEFWALHNVNFEVRPGTVLGMIGRNGAGKSTLLKLLSRITEPTEGFIRMNGRVACLLGVGTGFHKELTGRENVFLNGAILGMSRAEIVDAFDQIVEFAGVERFIDMPVKRYSSGMELRLAFSVAAHLRAEILLVDEVLAVGDAAFQRKCLGKMGDVARQGRTVLVVSHDMAAIRTLCDSALVLDHGNAVFAGSSADAVARYLHLAGEYHGAARDLRDWRSRSGSGVARIVWGGISWDGPGVDQVTMGDTLTVQFDVERDPTVTPGELRFSCVIGTITGIPVLHISNEDAGFTFPALSSGRVTVRIPGLTLFPGEYTVSLWTGNEFYDDYDYVRDCLRFDVVQGDMPPRAYRMSWLNGLAYAPSEWSIGSQFVTEL